MTQDPFYEIVRLMGARQSGVTPALGILQSAAERTFALDGSLHRMTACNADLTLTAQDEGGTFLCLLGGKRLYVLCRIREET